MTAVGGVIGSYYSSGDRPAIPYWTLGFADATLRLLGSDDFSPRAKRQAAEALAGAVLSGELCQPVGHRFSLEEIATAHEVVEGGGRGRILIDLT